MGAPSCRDVYRLLRRGVAFSAEDMVRAIGGGTAASVTARVRDLRKPEWGAHVVVCARGPDGVYRYQLVPSSCCKAGEARARLRAAGA